MPRRRRARGGGGRRLARDPRSPDTAARGARADAPRTCARRPRGTRPRGRYQWGLPATRHRGREPGQRGCEVTAAGRGGRLSRLHFFLFLCGCATVLGGGVSERRRGVASRRVSGGGLVSALPWCHGRDGARASTCEGGWNRLTYRALPVVERTTDALGLPLTLSKGFRRHHCDPLCLGRRARWPIVDCVALPSVDVELPDFCCGAPSCRASPSSRRHRAGRRPCGSILLSPLTAWAVRPCALPNRLGGDPSLGRPLAAFLSTSFGLPRAAAVRFLIGRTLPTTSASWSSGGCWAGLGGAAATLSTGMKHLAAAT